MNAPLAARDIEAATGTLRLFALFHLNLAFSSIEEEQRGEVIARCYWPLLRLARNARPDRHRSDRLHAGGNRDARSGMDRRGARPDRTGPHRTDRLRLCADDRAAGSGARDAKKISPSATRSMSACWARRPVLALVNEQAYSGGLVGLYLDAGYRAPADGLGQSRRASSRMACGNALSAATRAWHRRPHRSRCSGPTPSHSRNCSASRMAISDSTPISIIVRGQRGRNARALVLLCQRCGDFRFPSRPLPHGRKARRRKRMGEARRALSRASATSPVSSWSRRPAILDRARSEPPAAAAGKRRLPDPGQEAAQIQSVALGRDRARQYRHQRRLRAHLPRAGRRRRRSRRLEGALLSLVQRFPHPYHRQALGSILRPA